MGKARTTIIDMDSRIFDEFIAKIEDFCVKRGLNPKTTLVAVSVGKNFDFGDVTIRQKPGHLETRIDGEMILIFKHEDKLKVTSPTRLVRNKTMEQYLKAFVNWIEYGVFSFIPGDNAEVFHKNVTRISSEERFINPDSDPVTCKAIKELR